MGNVVLYLKENWNIYYPVFAGVCVILYIVSSILIVRRCRKYNYDIGVSGMIPVINIIVFFKSFKYKKAKVVS